MNKHAFAALRIGLGVTFIWIGFMIWNDPMGWGGFIQQWAVDLMPMPVERVMMSTAVLDILLGICMILNLFTPLVGLISTAHLIVILVTSGINGFTVRDIGLLGAALALTLETRPQTLKGWLKVR